MQKHYATHLKVRTGGVASGFGQLRSRRLGFRVCVDLTTLTPAAPTTTAGGLHTNPTITTANVGALSCHLDGPVLFLAIFGRGESRWVMAIVLSKLAANIFPPKPA